MWSSAGRGREGGAGMRSEEGSREAVTLHWPSFPCTGLAAAATAESWQE